MEYIFFLNKVIVRSIVFIEYELTKELKILEKIKYICISIMMKLRIGLNKAKIDFVWVRIYNQF